MPHHSTLLLHASPSPQSRFSWALLAAGAVAAAVLVVTHRPTSRLTLWTATQVASPSTTIQESSTIQRPSTHHLPTAIQRSMAQPIQAHAQSGPYDSSTAEQKFGVPLVEVSRMPTATSLHATLKATSNIMIFGGAILGALAIVARFFRSCRSCVAPVAPIHDDDMAYVAMASATGARTLPSKELHEQRKREWIARSVTYYSKVMREERRRNIGQAPNADDPEYQEAFADLALKHYYALRSVKDGKLRIAEKIYRNIIDELSQEEDGHCDYAKLAVTMLLLALLMQRVGNKKATRSVFLKFFRMAVIEGDSEKECACSAKVLGAYALFEMNCGNVQKSSEIVTRAVQFDHTLAPLLQWKQFRDVLERRPPTSETPSLPHA